MNSAVVWQPRLWQWLISALVLLLIGLSAWLLDKNIGDSQLVFSLLAGAAFGFILQRSRFCFYCITRDFLEQRAASGLLGLLAALAVGTLGYHAVFGAFLPEAAADRLPPGAHIGPVSFALILAAAAFGFGMALAGSCISAQLYRLGEGSFGGLLALVGVLLGFVFGFYSWNFLYLRLIQSAPVVWLPHYFGYGGSLLLQLVLITALAAVVIRYSRKQETLPQSGYAETIFGRRWSTIIGGILIGILGTLVYLRVAPLGVTAEIGSIARTAATNLPAFPLRLEGLDTFRGCATVIKETILSNNGVFVLALIAGAFAAALPAGDFRPQLPARLDILRLLAGGVFIGWGAMIALGCTVGVLLSGIMTAALSGWVFLVACFCGLWAGWRLRRISSN
jgi:hypothetical protein